MDAIILFVSCLIYTGIWFAILYKLKSFDFMRRFQSKNLWNFSTITALLLSLSYPPPAFFTIGVIMVPIIYMTIELANSSFDCALREIGRW